VIDATRMSSLLGRFSLSELAGEAEREVVLREAVFPSRVRAGRMGAEEARRRLEMMRQIARLLRNEAGDEQEKLL
jgi:hypothetical protein